MNQIVAMNTTETVSAVAERFFTIKKFAQKNREQGTWPDSEAAIWALRANAPQNGFGKAFLTVGRRVLVNEEKFWEAIAFLQEAKNVCKR